MAFGSLKRLDPGTTVLSEPLVTSLINILELHYTKLIVFNV